MGWIDPTALVSAPPQAIILFSFVPPWLILLGGLILSTVAIALDQADARAFRSRHKGPSMTPRALRASGGTAAPSSNNGQFLRSAGKG